MLRKLQKAQIVLGISCLAIPIFVYWISDEQAFERAGICLLALGAVYLIFAWLFVTDECPDCNNSILNHKKDSFIVDKYRGSKAVQDKDSNGNVIAERTIAVDYKKVQTLWQCRQCGNEFETYETKEM